MYSLVNVNFSSANRSFNLRCPNLIMHLAYCIDLDFHSFHHVKDIKMGSISNSLLFVTDIYLRLNPNFKHVAFKKPEFNLKKSGFLV